MKMLNFEFFLYIHYSIRLCWVFKVDYLYLDKIDKLFFSLNLKKDWPKKFSILVKKHFTNGRKNQGQFRNFSFSDWKSGLNFNSKKSISFLSQNKYLRCLLLNFSKLISSYYENHMVISFKLFYHLLIIL